MANNDSKASFKVYLDFQTTGKSIKDVDAEFKKLNNTIRRDLVPGTKAYNDAVAKQRELGKVLDDHKAKVKGVGGVWQSLSKEVKAFGMIALGAIGFQAITGQIGNLIRKTADLSDTYANIQKTTGLTAKEVDALGKELGKIDTRTSRIELLKLASEAGKLGITGAGNIKKFVNEADKINVALGEDLGQGAILAIGKLSDVFGTGMLNIGSAINSLGAASAASEGYLVDFAARLGGIAKTAGISAPDILGYGAVLDSLGLQAEMSSTALSNFFIDFTKNVGKFESAAGMASGSLQELIGKEGTNAGFMAFLENLKASSTGADDFLRRLEKLGIDGSRGAQVFLTLSNNIGMVKDQQKIANTEFTKGTSIIDEFNVKNNTFAANLEKFQKKLGSALLGWMEPLSILINRVIDMRTEAQKLSDTYNTLSESQNDLEKEINPLIKRYDELNGKTELSKEEHDELNNIIERISQLLPSAVTEWDKYGKAVDISTDKVRKAMESNRELIQATQSDAIKQLQKSIKELEFTAKSLQGDLNLGTKAGGGAFGGGGQFGSVKTERVALTDAETTEIRNKLISTQKTIYDNLIALRDTFKVVLNKSQQDFVAGFEKQFGQVDKIINEAKNGTTLGAGAIAGSGNSALDKIEEKVKRIKQQAIELKTLLPTINSEIAEPAMKAIIPLDSLSDAPFSTPEDAPKTDEEWDELKNKASESLNTISTIGNGVISIIDNVSARQQDELNEFLNIQEKKKNALNDLYENGKLSAEDYNKKVRALDQESANKQREFAQKQARRQKVAAIFDSVINTARAVVAALPNIPLSVAVGAIGTINTGLIAGRPIPQFAEGGSTFADGGGVMQPRLGLIGEKGPEWVAPNWMLRNPATADVIGALEAMRQNKGRAFADGGNTLPGSGSSTSGLGLGVASNGELVQMLKGVERTNMLLMQQLQQPISAFMKWKDGDTRELAEKQTRYDEILEDNSIR
jgi:TP901 family phage tail tape measure protein